MKQKKGRKDAAGAAMQVEGEAAEPPLKLVDDLDFEDEAEDEFEEEEEVLAADDDDDDEDGAVLADSGDAGPSGFAAQRLADGDADDADTGPSQVWRPGVDSLQPGEELDFDPSAYDVMHSFHADWPCLSFAIVPDELGNARTKPPFGATLVAGTQASQPSDNKLLCMRLSKLGRVKHDDDDDDMDDDDDEVDEEPLMEHRAVKHEGTVNRLCLMPQQPSVCATWSDRGTVQLWDLSAVYGALAEPARAKVSAPPPLFTFDGHGDEGYAVDFSRVVAGRLATGSCNKRIHVWSASPAGTWTVDAAPYLGHEASVEDIAWSPVEPTVFASCSADTRVAIWDVRKRDGMALSVKAHATDANVISWNTSVSYLLVSGADDGSIKIWDLRTFRSGEPVASFTWHKAPITSVEWNPNESSSIAVAGADNQLTLWDLALEDDPEAKQIEKGRDDLADIPAQLYFVHQGQSNMKELHWHPQMPGVVISTAEDGFHLFRPAN